MSSSLPWRPVDDDDDEANSAHHSGVTSHDVTRRHDNVNPVPVLSAVDARTPLLSGAAHWLLQPAPVFPQSHHYMSVPVMPPTQCIAAAADTGGIRLPESAKVLLTSWYETHVRHPYPQPDELSQLVAMTGQSRRKILKWLANRRARTGNTLPHNGSVHPRKIVKIRQLRQLASETAEPQHGGGAGQTTGRSRQRSSSRFLPESVVEGLRRWYDDHLGYPYPTDAEKRHLAEQLGTTVVKVTNWFANKRNRSGHSKSGNVRHGTASMNALSASPASQMDWRYLCLSHSLPMMPFVQTRQHVGHLP